MAEMIQPTHLSLAHVHVAFAPHLSVRCCAQADHTSMSTAILQHTACCHVYAAFLSETETESVSASERKAAETEAVAAELYRHVVDMLT